MIACEELSRGIPRFRVGRGSVLLSTPSLFTREILNPRLQAQNPNPTPYTFKPQPETLKRHSQAPLMYGVQDGEALLNVPLLTQHPAPTPYPTPLTLQPAPCTLHPSPDPTPCTQHSTPYTLPPPSPPR
jgi:hypothetical protein